MAQIALRDARRDDVSEVYALLQESFASDLLPFTIYRSPKASGYLADLADQCRIRVSDRLDGIAISTGSHLDYLAVSKAARGRGLGRALVDDFHASRETTTLDVIADNSAISWYRSLGYREERVSWNVKLETNGGGEPPLEWKAALDRERLHGFAAVEYQGMRVGLLAGSALRIIDLGSKSLLEATEALRMIDYAGRRELVVLGASEVPKDFAVMKACKTIAMRRES